MEGECDDLDGAFEGAGSTCIPYPCPVPWACCLGDGSCEMLLREECWTRGGAFQGFDVTCESNPCEQPSDVEEGPEGIWSWGRIKSAYR